VNGEVKYYDGWMKSQLNFVNHYFHVLTNYIKHSLFYLISYNGKIDEHSNDGSLIVYRDKYRELLMVNQNQLTAYSKALDALKLRFDACIEVMTEETMGFYQFSLWFDYGKLNVIMNIE
jgi:uncharacterized Fe-S center protein